MSTRMIRTLAIAAGAGALVLSAAAPAMAADSFTNDTLPAKTVLTPASLSATVNLTTPEGYDCTKWTVRKVGQKRERNSVTVTPMATAGAACTSAAQLFTVSIPADYAKKGNVVVKFVVTNTDGTMKMVENLVVKLNPTAKPTTGKPQ